MTFFLAAPLVDPSSKTSFSSLVGTTRKSSTSRKPTEQAFLRRRQPASPRLPHVFPAARVSQRCKLMAPTQSKVAIPFNKAPRNLLTFPVALALRRTAYSERYPRLLP